MTRPARSTSVQLVLDAGATTTLLKLKTLVYLGIDPGQPLRMVQLTTGSTIETVPLVMLTRFSALGQHRFGFRVIGHDLPTGTQGDGLIGLDFFRGHALNIDLRAGRLDLS